MWKIVHIRIRVLVILILCGIVYWGNKVKVFYLENVTDIRAERNDHRRRYIDPL